MIVCGEQQLKQWIELAPRAWAAEHVSQEEEVNKWKVHYLFI